MNLLKLLREARKIYRHRYSVRTFLEFCEHPNQSISGTVHPNDLAFLGELVKLADSIPGPIVEIGMLFGFTTQHLAKWKQHDKELITIDNFCWNPIGMNPSVHYEFSNRILFYLQEKCRTRIFKGKSGDFYESYTGERPSMVFIDAGHTYDEIIIDIKWAVDNAVPIISGHDYKDDWPGVKRAVDQFFANSIKVVGSCWAYIDR